MNKSEIELKLKTIRNNNALPEKQKGMLIDKYEKMLAEMGGGEPAAKPKAERKPRTVKPKAETTPKSDDYDCDDLIEDAKERKAKALAAYEKRKNAPKKSATTKAKETIEKAEKTVEKGVKKGDISISEIEKIISEYEDAIQKLKDLLERAKGKMKQGGSVDPEEVEHILMKAQGIKEHHCKCNDKMEKGGKIEQIDYILKETTDSTKYRKLTDIRKKLLHKIRLTDSDVKYLEKEGIDTYQFAKGGPVSEKVVDLFEDYEKIPKNVKTVLDKYSKDFDEENYSGIKKAHTEIEKLGYTFEFYIDGSVFALRPKSVKLNQVVGFEDENNPNVQNKSDVNLSKYNKKVYQKNGEKLEVYFDSDGEISFVFDSSGNLVENLKPYGMTGVFNREDNEYYYISKRMAQGGSVENEISYIDSRIKNLSSMRAVSNPDERDYFDNQISKLEKEKANLSNPSKKRWFF